MAGWHTEAAQVALSSTQPAGRTVVVVTVAGLQAENVRRMGGLCRAPS